MMVMMMVPMGDQPREQAGSVALNLSTRPFLAPWFFSFSLSLSRVSLNDVTRTQLARGGGGFTRPKTGGHVTFVLRLVTRHLLGGGIQFPRGRRTQTTRGRWRAREMLGQEGSHRQLLART